MRLLFVNVLLFASTPLAAQDSLDRTDPIQAEELDQYPVETSEDAEPASPASRPAQPSRTRAEDTLYPVSSILIEGNTALPDSAFLDIIERYTAQPLSGDDLYGLANAIAGRARDRGYIFATAAIAEQTLDFGVLRVTLDEGRIDQIRMDGVDDPAVRRQLEALVIGEPITRDELERRILLADDISGVRILDTRYEKDGEAGILIVRARRSRASALVEVQNNGSQPVGPVRAQIEIDLNGVIDAGDEIDLSIGTTPLQPEELQFARGSYRIVVDSSGLELGAHLSYSATEPGAFLEDRDIAGRFWRIGLDARYPVLRRRALSVWVVGEFEVTDLRQERAGGLVRQDRVPVVRAGIYSRGRLAGGDFRGGLTASRGLDILSATRAGDPLASRDDASAQFSSLYGWLGWDTSLAGDFSIAFGARGQLATAPLLATEDLGLGGTSFIRGYRFNERTGDQGIMGYGELRYNWRGEGFWLPRGQVYVFADGGTVTNLRDGRGSGSLASAGGGMRLDLTRDLDLGFELAVPLMGERSDTDSDAPLVNVRVQQSF